MLSFLGNFAFAMDCKAAREKTEKLVCANARLMALDEALNKLYRETLASAKNPEALKREQLAWLRTLRAGCDSESCLEQAYGERLITLEAVPRFQWIRYSDKTLGIEFLYPSNRKLTRQGNDVYLSAARMPEGHDYLIHFKVGKGDFKTANAEESLFEERAGKWIAAIGRFENPPAETISGAGWKGLRTTITCSISNRKTGFHAAGGQCFWGLISDGRRYVVADTSGLLGLDENTQKSFMSLQFLPQP